MRISVVIPTYARLRQLGEVIDHLLLADPTDFEDIEIIVVDDGSPETPEELLANKRFEAPFRYRFIRQANAGPSAARNNGFRSAGNDVVLFVDDDVLLPVGGLAGHYRAHQDRPNSVIFGLYPYAVPAEPTPSYKYLDQLEREARVEVAGGSAEKYIRAKIVASGNLSVERASFASRAGVYDETLKTPMAEEIELALRLEAEGIPIYYAPALNALHTQPTTIRGKCIQDYKYGLGVAEAYCRLRDRAPRGQFEHTMKVNGPIASGDSLQLKVSKLSKSILGSNAGRASLMSAVALMECVVPANEKLLFVIYRKAVGVHYFAGIREGLRTFCKLQDRS